MEADRSLADNLPSLEPGQFLLLTSESEGRKVTTMNARRLLTSHGPPIPSKELDSLTLEEQRLWANSMTTKGSNDSIKISNKIRDSVIRKSPKANKKRISGPSCAKWIYSFSRQYRSSSCPEEHDKFDYCGNSSIVYCNIRRFREEWGYI
jgi:hypothetical protein